MGELDVVKVKDALHGKAFTFWGGEYHGFWHGDGVGAVELSMKCIDSEYR
jgi:hypothetical protein